jgi:hypothetical protein
VSFKGLEKGSYMLRKNSQSWSCDSSFQFWQSCYPARLWTAILTGRHYAWIHQIKKNKQIPMTPINRTGLISQSPSDFAIYDNRSNGKGGLDCQHPTPFK